MEGRDTQKDEAVTVSVMITPIKGCGTSHKQAILESGPLSFLEKSYHERGWGKTRVSVGCFETDLRYF